MEIRNKQFIEFDSLITKLLFDYDEIGNRIRRRIYFLDNSANETSNPWILQHDYIYSRGSDGKELVIYDNGIPKQWNIFGLNKEGYLNNNDTMYYYFKDHLGSVRASVNQNNILKNAQDYDAWGYLIQNRNYESNNLQYKFTEKERDNESGYDYFGARYYLSRIGRWSQVEPLLEKFYKLSPYVYSADCPIRIIDVNGRDVIIQGEDATTSFKYLKTQYSHLNLTMDENGKLSYSGIPKSPEELVLINAIENSEVIVNLITTRDNVAEGSAFAVGLYTGSTVDENGISHVNQYFNVNHAAVFREAGGGPISRSVLHEILEGYIGGYLYAGQNYDQSYNSAHDKTVSLENPRRFYPTDFTHTIFDKDNNIHLFQSRVLIDANGKEHLLYSKEDLE